MSATTAITAKGTETRVRLLESATDLFSRQGFGATGIKAVLAAAEAPYGSLYHFFPGGKQELGAAALSYGGDRYRSQLEALYPAGGDVVAATAESFDRAVKLLEESDFGYACPIATIALEIADSDEVMRKSAAAAFESWLVVLQERFTKAGMATDRARDVAVEIFCLIEGSLLLARTIRSVVPVQTAGRTAVDLVTAGLAAADGD